MTRTVLLPVDASGHSEKAFNWYVENMYHADDTLIVLHCHDMRAPSGQVTEKELKELIEKHDKHAKELEDKYEKNVSSLKLADGGYKFVLACGHAGETICAKIVELKPDMVVLGSRGLGTIRRTFLGSCSDYVLHHSHVPVVIVPHH